jgi:Lipase (class 3)
VLEGNISAPRRRSLIDTLRWTSADHIGSRKLGCESPSRQSNTSETPTLPDSRHNHLQGEAAIVPEAHPGKKVKGVGVRRVKVTMYNFGSPRVGNGFFALLYNRIVPDSFRTVVDGDLVTSMPPTGYRHIGTQAVVDNLGAGSIIIDPSFIERRLRTHTKSSVSVHSLLVYRKVRVMILSIIVAVIPSILMLSAIYSTLNHILFCIFNPNKPFLFFCFRASPVSKTLLSS